MPSYTRPPTRANNDFITAAIWNRDVVANERSMAPGCYLAKGDSFWAVGADDGGVLSAGDNGDIIVYDSTADLGVRTASAGRVWLISDTVLGSAASTIDITSIPGTFRHLIANVAVRSDYTGTTDTLICRVNNVSSAKYYHQRVGVQAASGGVTAAALTGLSALYCGLISGDTATASMFGLATILFADYADSAKKPTALTRSGRGYGTTADDTCVRVDFAVFDTAGAVTRLTFDVLSGTNLKQYSRVTLYGIL